MAVLRALKTKSVIGLSITSFRHKVSVNGVKIVDANGGGMLPQDWATFSYSLLNASDALQLVEDARGDALSGLLLVDAILCYKGCSIQDWNELYISTQLEDIVSSSSSMPIDGEHSSDWISHMEPMQMVGDDALRGEISDFEPGYMLYRIDECMVANFEDQEWTLGKRERGTTTYVVDTGRFAHNRTTRKIESRHRNWFHLTRLRGQWASFNEAEL